MKKMMIMAGLAVLTMAAGCSKIKSIADINVDLPYSTQLTVPAIPGYPDGATLPAGGASIPFPSIAIPTNSQQYLDQYHTSGANIRSLTLKSMGLQILTPPSQTFDFVDTIQLYISSKNHEEQLVAYGNNFPTGASSINLTNAGVDLKDYFLDDTMYFRMRAHVKGIPASGTQLNIDAKFHMVANPLY